VQVRLALQHLHPELHLPRGVALGQADRILFRRYEPGAELRCSRLDVAEFPGREAVVVPLLVVLDAPDAEVPAGSEALTSEPLTV